MPGAAFFPAIPVAMGPGAQCHGTEHTATGGAGTNGQFVRSITVQTAFPETTWMG
jgi:hypothetical protein